LSEYKLTLINNLKSGEFSFFKPIGNTDITRLMVDMNKELMIVMDNPNFKRESNLKINDKMYKVFTFQNQELTKKKYSNFSTSEGFDEGGQYFLEYDFSKQNSYNYKPDYFLPLTNDNCVT